MKPKGFTLIEILVVVAILGIMASAAVPMLMGQIERSYQSEARSCLNIIYTAERIYYLDNGVFWNYTGSNPPVTTINSYLKTDLVDSAYYTITSVGTSSAQMQRKTGSPTLTIDYSTGSISQT